MTPPKKRISDRPFLCGCIVLLAAVSLSGPSSGQGRDPEVLAAERAVRGRPSDPEASFRLARVASAKGDFQTAITALERLLILYPDLANIRLELGVLYLRTGAPALGEAFIREALKSPSAPADVRARAEELLAVAEQQSKPLRFSAQIGGGLIHDSNANFGPPDGVTVGGLPVEEGTGEADTSAYLTLGGQLRYDPGFQAGHILTLDAGYFGRRYRDQDNLDLDRLSVAPGVEFDLTRSFGRPTLLALRAEFSELRRDGDRYLREKGVRANLTHALDPTNQLRLSAFWYDQDYIPDGAFTGNDRRDGNRRGIDLRWSHALDADSALTLGIEAADKSAAVAYEAYSEYGLSVGYERRIAPLVGKGEPWSFGVSLGASRRDYDGADPAIDPDAAEEDTAVSLVARLAVPLTEKGVLLIEAGRTKYTSNYDIKEYDNTHFSVAFNRRF